MKHKYGCEYITVNMLYKMLPLGYVLFYLSICTEWLQDPTNPNSKTLQMLICW